MSAPAMLLRVYAFAPGTTFSGGLVGAFERSGGGLRDALLVLGDASADDVDAIDLQTGTADGTFARLLDFRLDPGSRRRATALTVAHAQEAVDALREGLRDRGALLAVILAPEGEAGPLEDAVAAGGGTLVGERPVEETAITRLAPQLRAVLAGS